MREFVPAYSRDGIPMRELNRNAIGDRDKQVITHVSAETRVGNSESIDVDGQNSMALAQAGLARRSSRSNRSRNWRLFSICAGLVAPAFNLQAKRAPFYSIAYIHR
jgi:hypothetical protein